MLLTHRSAHRRPHLCHAGCRSGHSSCLRSRRWALCCSITHRQGGGRRGATHPVPHVIDYPVSQISNCRLHVCHSATGHALIAHADYTSLCDGIGRVRCEASRQGSLPPPEAPGICFGARGAKGGVVCANGNQCVTTVIDLDTSGMAMRNRTQTPDSVLLPGLHPATGRSWRYIPNRYRLLRPHAGNSESDFDGFAGRHRLQEHKLEAVWALSVDGKESTAARTKSSKADASQAEAHSKCQTAECHTETSNRIWKRAVALALV